MWILGRKGASTAEEVARGIDGSALTAIVTGASSGIGTETARVLALCGVHVIMAVRNVESGKNVRETIVKENPEAKIDVMELDLASFASIRKFASDYNSYGLPLNILINNAGVMVPSFMLSKDNIELHFATNHLGHFLLTNLLLDNMKKTASESQKEGRIVNVSSIGHRFVSREGIRFDKINYNSSFFSIHAYGKSKLANILHANELARRFKEAGFEITANSLHPGVVATKIFRYNGIFQGEALTPHFNSIIFSRQLKILKTGLVNRFSKYFFQDIAQGAATTCYVALHPQVKRVSGKYFANTDVSRPSQLALYADLGKQLWDFSSNITQLDSIACSSASPI